MKTVDYELEHSASGKSSGSTEKCDRAFCYIFAPFTDIKAAEEAYATVCAVRMIAEAALVPDKFNKITEAFAYCSHPDETYNRDRTIRAIIPEFKPIDKSYYPNIPELPKEDGDIIDIKIDMLYTAAISAADFAVHNYLNCGKNRRADVFVIGNMDISSMDYKKSLTRLCNLFKLSEEEKGEKEKNEEEKIRYVGRGTFAVLLNDDGDDDQRVELPCFHIKNDDDIRKLKVLLKELLE